MKQYSKAFESCCKHGWSFRISSRRHDASHERAMEGKIRQDCDRPSTATEAMMCQCYCIPADSEPVDGHMARRGQVSRYRSVHMPSLWQFADE